jgi:hypothetical protein
MGKRFTKRERWGGGFSKDLVPSLETGINCTLTAEQMGSIEIKVLYRI